VGGAVGLSVDSEGRLWVGQGLYDTGEVKVIQYVQYENDTQTYLS
jgi:hypothetical protein